MSPLSGALFLEKLALLVSSVEICRHVNGRILHLSKLFFYQLLVHPTLISAGTFAPTNLVEIDEADVRAFLFVCLANLFGESALSTEDRFVLLVLELVAVRQLELRRYNLRVNGRIIADAHIEQKIPLGQLPPLLSKVNSPDGERANSILF